MTKRKNDLISLFIYTIIFVFWVWQFEWVKTTFLFFIRERSDVVQRITLPELALQHLWIVFVSSLVAFVLGMLLALSVHLSQSAEFRALVVRIATLGETLPTVSLLALSVPLLGYGNTPLILALALYGILPILRNALAGFDHISPAIQEASQALGLNAYQRLWRIELPLIRPYVLSGLRITTIINVSAATIGSTVGAGGLGVLIVSGIRSYNPLLIIQATIPVIVLALWIDRLLRI